MSVRSTGEWVGGSAGRQVGGAGDSGGEGGGGVLVEGCLERGGGAQHDEIAVLGPHQLQADGQATVTHGNGHAGGGGAGHVEGIGELHPVGRFDAVDGTDHVVGQGSQRRARRRDQDAAAVEQLDQPQVHAVVV